MKSFFGGLEPALRKIVQSTYDDREKINAIMREEYKEIKRRRLSLKPEDTELFWRNVGCIVEKDGVRTDRGNPCNLSRGGGVQ